MAATVAQMAPDFRTQQNGVGGHRVVDTSLRDLWMEHIDSKYWAERRFKLAAP